MFHAVSDTSKFHKRCWAEGGCMRVCEYVDQTGAPEYAFVALKDYFI